MQPLYTKTEFKDAKSRQLLPLRCLHCTKTFHRTKHDIQISLLVHRRGTNNYCSYSCSGSHCRPSSLTVQCVQCHSSFKKWPSQIKRHPRHFCSSSCAAKWNNTHKTKGTRASKLEAWLASTLPALYPGLEFHFNHKDAINAELDIYIPSLRLAFELNGIFHYIPIYGLTKLASMQTNDARKVQACLERNIELCVIDVSHQKYFKEQRALEFLPIITNIINSKLSESSPAVNTAA